MEESIIYSDWTEEDASSSSVAFDSHEDSKESQVDGAMKATLNEMTMHDDIGDATTLFSVADLQHQQRQAIKKAGPSQEDINRARLLLIIAAALYGTNFSLVKLLGQTEVPVGLSSTLRFAMAALATSPWLFGTLSDEAKVQQENTLINDHNAMPIRLGATLAGMEVGMWGSIGYIAQAVGLETTLASKSAFLCSLAVVIVPILDFIAGKRLLPREMLGALLALVGVGVLELGGMEASDLALTSGDIASLIQPLAFGMGFWRMERAMQKYPTEANRSTAAQLLSVFLGSLAYCLVTDPQALNWAEIESYLTNPMIVLSLFWTGVVSTALTVYMETLALKTLSAAETTLIFSSEPLWGTAFAAAVMGEQLGLDTALGAVLIVGGCVFSNLGFQGIKELVTGKKEVVSIGEDGQSPAEDDLPENMAALDPRTPPGSMVRAGTVFASFAGVFGSLWNNVAMSTRIFAMDLSDFLENILPSVPPDV